jgi:hypothetical protein
MRQRPRQVALWRIRSRPRDLLFSAPLPPILVHCVAAVIAERFHNICHALLTPGFDAVAPARANVAAREMKSAHHVTRRKS